MRLSAPLTSMSRKDQTLDRLRHDEPPGGAAAGDFTLAEDPWPLFAAWMAEAEASEPVDANAMALATADADGLPDVRMVLLKGADPRGFVFYTNLESEKGVQLARNPQAALVLYWKSLGRQIRARGPVTAVTPEEADAYFASRHPESRRGAVASRQSRPLADRATLIAEVADVARRCGDGPVPRPETWSGFRLAPVAIEFWRNGEFRLHDRVRFTRGSAGWSRTRLYP